jgi:hypothetical protein
MMSSRQSSVPVDDERSSIYCFLEFTALFGRFLSPLHFTRNDLAFYFYALFVIIRTSSCSVTPYFSKISFFTRSRSQRTSCQVALVSLIKKLPCCSLTLTPPTRVHLSPARSMSRPDERVHIGVRNSERVVF